MGKPSRWKIAPAMLVLFAAIGASGQTFTSLLDFDGTNGSYPLGYLAQGTDGNFYGVTNGGGGRGLRHDLQAHTSRPAHDDLQFLRPT